MHFLFCFLEKVSCIIVAGGRRGYDYSTVEILTDMDKRQRNGKKMQQIVNEEGWANGLWCSTYISDFSKAYNSENMFFLPNVGRAKMR